MAIGKQVKKVYVAYVTTLKLNLSNLHIKNNQSLSYVSYPKTPPKILRLSSQQKHTAALSFFSHHPPSTVGSEWELKM